MNQSEFLNKLNESLIRFSVDERKEILSDYREHFEEAKAEGRKEEEIVNQLGSPEEVARAYNMERLINKFDSEESVSKKFFSLIGAFFAAFSLSLFNFIFVLLPFLAVLFVLFLFWIFSAIPALVSMKPLFVPVSVLSDFGINITAKIATIVGLIATSGFLICMMCLITNVFIFLVITYLKANVKLIINVGR